MDAVPRNIAPLVKVGEVVGRWFAERRTDKELGLFEACVEEVIHAAVAAALGAVPRDEDFAEFTTAFENEVASPRFAARAQRLFTAMLSTPSKAHRLRLAAILTAGPLAIEEQTRLDRLDLLVASLLDGEIELLRQLGELTQGEGRSVEFNGARVVVRVVGEGGELARERSEGAAAPSEEGVGIVDLMSLEALETLGCIRVMSDGATTFDQHAVQTVTLTATGRFLLAALQRKPIREAIDFPSRSARAPREPATADPTGVDART